jgi:hypothetical protein
MGRRIAKGAFRWLIRGQRVRSFLRKVPPVIIYGGTASLLLIVSIHGLFHENTSATLLLIAVALALILADSVLEKLSAIKTVDEVEYFPEKDRLYTRIAMVMSEAFVTRQDNKELLLAALHGASAKQSRKSEHGLPFAVFDFIIDEYIKSQDWSVKCIWSVDSKETLDRVIGFVEEARSSPNYEVRCLTVEQTLPHCCPLVVGDSNAFLAVDDPTFYRVRAGVHIRGERAVELARQHFNDLWNDQRLIVLRGPGGPVRKNMDQLRLIFDDRT